MTESKAEVARRADDSQQGFALVLAILSLMLLTFLGLTLAATTSTELQIATNYRWSQQALYNAEAGIEAGKIILRNITAADFSGILPSDRGAGVTWKVSDVAPPAAPTVPAGSSTPAELRNFENAGCDRRGGGVGYGAVLSDDGLSALSQGDVQFRTVLFNQRLNGAVTLWVRRGVIVNPATGAFNDDSNNNAVVLTAEGVAPYTEEVLGEGPGAVTNFVRAQMAVRVLEVAVLRGTVAGGVIGDPCETYRGQTGGGVSGSGFAACGRGVTGCPAAGLISGALDQAGRDAGGSLSHAGGAGGDTGTLCGNLVD